MDYKNKYLKYKQKYLALKDALAQGGSIKQKYLALKEQSSFAQGGSLKQKYLALKDGLAQGGRNFKINQNGGAQIKVENVPNPLPHTQSWLFMALIYQNLQDINMVYAFPMDIRFSDAIFNYNQARPYIGAPVLPFATYAAFNALVVARLATFQITRRAQLIPPFDVPAVAPRFHEDSPCHISQASQEEILYATNLAGALLGGVAPHEFYGFLAEQLRTQHAGLAITYNTNP